MVNLSKKVWQYRLPYFLISCFPDKAFAALGAADVDLAAASGNPDGLLASGAAEIPVLFVLQMVEEIDKRSVFPASGLQIAGVCAEDAGEKGDIGNQTEEGQFFPKHRAEDHQRKTADEQSHIQFIGAITAQHKITEPVANSSEHQITCHIRVISIISSFLQETSPKPDCSQILYGFSVCSTMVGRWGLFHRRMPPNPRETARVVRPL